MKTIIAAAALAVAATGAFAEGLTHYVAIHVDENDPHVMNMALNNVTNVSSHYASQGDEAVIEVVAYGPGLNMYTQQSPVAERIAMMAMEIDDLSFAACGNTYRAMSERAGREVPLLAEAHIVPSGVVRLIELQEQGYPYVRP
jgi:intracellular sulfur oxidation DsrE/DsrF family protein